MSKEYLSEKLKNEISHINSKIKLEMKRPKTELYETPSTQKEETVAFQRWCQPGPGRTGEHLPLQPKHQIPLKTFDPIQPIERNIEMRCPIDNETLIISERNGVEIDYCPQCRGVWLDRGELDKIIDRSGSSESRNEDHRSFYKDQEYRTKRKKKSSFLEEIFDF